MKASTLVCLAVLISCVRCGGPTASPSAPSVPTSSEIAGTWSGTWTFVTAGVTVIDDARVTFSVDGAGVHGTWVAGSGPSGTITFANLPAGRTVSGTFTIDIATLSGACAGQAAVAGTMTNGEIKLSVETIPSTATCAWATDQRFSLTKG